jgi:endo-1,4-beta-xylanase
MKSKKRFALTALILLAALIPSQSQTTQPKFFGSIWQWNTQAGCGTRFTSLFDQTTPENAGKWGNVESSRGQYNWSTLDAMYAWANANNKIVKQHTFIWGKQLPGWIGSYTNSDTVKSILAAWMKAYMTRYGNQVDFIDVVNEPLHQSLSIAGLLGGSGTTGWDWVIFCFEQARKYAPNAKLLINEYWVINQDNATTDYLKIINLLKDRGLIDGIGEQAHGFAGQDTALMHRNLNRLAATGLPIYISEFDVDNGDDQGQLAAFKQLVPLFWNHPAIKGLTLWGYQQGATWLSNSYLVRSDGTDRPAMTWLLSYVKQPVSTIQPSVMRIVPPSSIISESSQGWFDLKGRVSPCLKTGNQVILNPAFGAIIRIDESPYSAMQQMPYNK